MKMRKIWWRNVYWALVSLELLALIGLWWWGGWRCLAIGLCLPLSVAVRVKIGEATK